MRQVSWRRVAGLALGFWLWYSVFADGAGLKVHLDVYPRVSLCLIRPCYKRVIMTIERAKDNRWMYLTWASDTGLSGSSFFQLDADESPTKFTRFIEVTRGDYYFQACLLRLVEGKSKRYCHGVYVEVR